MNSIHDTRLVKAEVASRLGRRGGLHVRRERRDSSLEIIRRTLARESWQELHPGETR